MSNAKFLKTKAAIYEMGLLFNQQPSDDRITAYAKMLSRYEPNQIIYAFKKVIASGSAFFPSLAEILSHLNPEHGKEIIDPAPKIASEMLSALRTYGPHAEVEMLQNVSNEARLTFKALGHTGDIRNSENIDTVRAQLERLARSVLKTHEASVKKDQLEKIGIEIPGRIKNSSHEMRPVNFSGFVKEKQREKV